MDAMLTERGRPRTTSGMFLDLKDLLRLVYRQRATIALCVLVTVFIGGVVLLNTPKRFTATTELFFETRSQKVSPIEAVLPGLSADRSVIESQIEALLSRPLFERALEKLEDAYNAEPFGEPAMIETEHQLDVGLGRTALREFLTEARTSDQDLRSKMGQLSVARRGLSYIVAISYTHLNPRVAALVANAIADAYITLQRDEKLRATTWASSQLQNRVKTVGIELRDDLQRLERFKTDNNLFKVGDLEVGEQLIADYIERLVTAQFKATNAAATARQLEQAALDPENLASLANVFESDAVVELRRQASAAQRRLNEVVNRYSDSHPAITAARIELENINKEIVFELDRLVKSALLEKEMASAQVRLVTESMDQLKEEYVRLTAARIELYSMESQVDAKRELYTSLLSRLSEIEIQSGLQADDAKILYYAPAPEVHSWPKTKMSLAILAIGGGLVGLALALLREVMNRKFREDIDVVAFTGQAPIVSFPSLYFERSPFGWFMGVRRREVQPPDHVKLFHGSAYGRAVYRLSLWLDDALAPGKRSVVLFASARDEDGRDALALNIAQFEHQRGKRTLCVEFSHAHGVGGLAAVPVKRPGRRYELVLDLDEASAGPKAAGTKTGAAKTAAAKPAATKTAAARTAAAKSAAAKTTTARTSAAKRAAPKSGTGAAAKPAAAEPAAAAVANVAASADAARIDGEVGQTEATAAQVASSAESAEAAAPHPSVTFSAWDAPDRGFVTLLCPPSDVLDGRFAQLIEAVSAQYDLIVVDWPAMLDPTNTPVVLEHADCVVFVVRAGRTEVSEYRNTLGQFIDDIASPVGIVLNKSGAETIPDRTEKSA